MYRIVKYQEGEDIVECMSHQAYIDSMNIRNDMLVIENAQRSGTRLIVPISRVYWIEEFEEPEAYIRAALRREEVDVEEEKAGEIATNIEEMFSFMGDDEWQRDDLAEKLDEKDNPLSSDDLDSLLEELRSDREPGESLIDIVIQLAEATGVIESAGDDRFQLA